MPELVWFPPPETRPEEWRPSSLGRTGFGIGGARDEAAPAPLVVAGDARASSRTLVIARALIRLAALARAPDDGKKTMRPTQLAVASARQALACLADAMERARVEPEIAATPDGGVKIVCRHEGRELEVTANRDGGGFQLRRHGLGQGETKSFGLIDDVRVAAKLLVG
ncbi:MAG TPA: hypothetical protein VKE22_02870 [Haliangiales bacterium]|nr:hypothetical protein [Haliangiales bacterium]